MRKQEIIVEIICSLLILLFVYAAVSKMVNFEKFNMQLHQSPMITSYSTVVGWFIPILEITICIMLMNNRFRLMALYSSFSLMTIFTTYIFLILNYSDHIPCSCGGILESMTWNFHLFFNLVFVLLIAIAVVLHTRVNRNLTKSLLQ